MNLSDDLQALWDVVRISMVCMMSVVIFGTYFNAIFPAETKVRHVECSVTLINMATKFNVTLLDECVIDEE